MAPPSCSPSSSKASSSSPFAPHPSPKFTAIEEGGKEEVEEDEIEDRKQIKAAPRSSKDKIAADIKHQATPLHHTATKAKSSARKRYELDDGSAAAGGVSCSNCRPNPREKISVVPLDNSSANRQTFPSPNGLFKSIFSTLTKKSPRSSSDSPLARDSREEQWKIALAELSHKLIQTTRKRDEAVLEASRLKYSMQELEKKLNKLEVYCHSLKSGLEVCTNNSPYRNQKTHHHQQQHIEVGNPDRVVEHFLVAVSESRSCIRILSRALAMQFRQMGGKVYERVSSLLQPYDIKASVLRSPRSLLFYLEALLNKSFFEDFESIGFEKNSNNMILNPIDRCEANFTSFEVLQGLTWEEVLSKGTKHFSEEFSRFCDRKMSEIVGMLGWNRAWPEPLLQAFFGASKTVWLVHLLANSVHPSLPIFRIDKGVAFDSVYMEDMGGDRAKKLIPTLVRIMVAPGFYVYGNVVKCKVLCRYHSNNSSSSNYSVQSFNPSSP